MKFSDLMRGNLTAEILCYRKGTVVRRLTVNGDTVTVNALTQTTDVPLTTPITYEPWWMDRGSMLFLLPATSSIVRGESTPFGKLCTEGDSIRFPDGQEFGVYPVEDAEHEDEGTSDAGERCY